jgi:hypothetical protein
MKIVTVRLESELHHGARIKLAEQRTSFQALLEAFIGSWVRGERTLERPKSSGAADLARLEYILANGTKDQVQCIRGNLKIFAEAVGGDTQTGEPQGSETLRADEKRLVEEYRTATLEKRRQILALAAKVQDLGPEVVAPRQSRASRRTEKTG